MVLAAVVVCAAASLPGAKAGSRSEDSTASGRGSPPRDAHRAAGRFLPGVTIHRQARAVDLDATVVTRKGNWLELLACSPHTHEYEAIVRVRARPSHIHLALLTLGIKPGKPMTHEKKDDRYVTHPPRGPKVAVSFIVKHHGREKRIPANQWVINQKTGKVLTSNRFLFTGSAIVQNGSRRLYMADLNGTVISLVNFGDDLLTRDTTTTNHNDNQVWGTNTKRIPPVGTKILVRLRPLPPEAPAKRKTNVASPPPPSR